MVARKGHYLFKLCFPRTNFNFLIQSLFSSHKLYYSRTNFIFLVQTLFSLYKVYFPRTNFNFLMQSLFSSHKLYYSRTNFIIIHQIHYEKSDWSRAFNKFTIACELDMVNVISAADITFIMSSLTSAWLLSPLECSPQ